MFAPGASDAGDRDAHIEGDEPAAMGHRRGEQQRVHGLGARCGLPAHGPFAGRWNAEVAMPLSRDLLEVRGGVVGSHRAKVTLAAHHADEPELRDGAGGETVRQVVVAVEPLQNATVVNVLLIEQRDQRIHVQQRAHQNPASSRSFATISLVTLPPDLLRFGTKCEYSGNSAPRSMRTLPGPSTVTVIRSPARMPASTGRRSAAGRPVGNSVFCAMRRISPGCMHNI